MRTLFLVVLLLSAALSRAALAESRVALVIGNAAYANAANLANPANDAEDLAAALDRLGFEVTRAADLDLEALRQTLKSFGDAARSADVAVVFFAGHGIEVDRANYLVPVDATLRSDRDIEFEAVPLDLVLHAVDGARRLKLVILDACRVNPFAATMVRTDASRSIGRGLARVEPRGETLVAFAAREGTVAADGEGRNSPFTAALLANIEEPGLELGFLFRRVRDAVIATTDNEQEPYVYGSLSSEGFYFNPEPARQSPDLGNFGNATELLAELIRAGEPGNRCQYVRDYERLAAGTELAPDVIGIAVEECWDDIGDGRPRTVATAMALKDSAPPGVAEAILEAIVREGPGTEAFAALAALVESDTVSREELKTIVADAKGREARRGGEPDSVVSPANLGSNLTLAGAIRSLAGTRLGSRIGVREDRQIPIPRVENAVEILTDLLQGDPEKMVVRAAKPQIQTLARVSFAQKDQFVDFEVGLLVGPFEISGKKALEVNLADATGKAKFVRDIVEIAIDDQELIADMGKMFAIKRPCVGFSDITEIGREGGAALLFDCDAVAEGITFEIVER